MSKERRVSKLSDKTKVLSKDSFGVSITGASFNEEKLELCKMVGMVEFTLDTLPGVNNSARSPGYTEASVNAIKKCVDAGIKTRAVTPLFPLTMRKENLESVYHFLCEQSCPERELLRFYPVGRGKTFLKENLEEIIRRSREKPEFKKKYCRTLNFLKNNQLPNIYRYRNYFLKNYPEIINPLSILRSNY